MQTLGPGHGLCPRLCAQGCERAQRDGSSAVHTWGHWRLRLGHSEASCSRPELALAGSRPRPELRLEASRPQNQADAVWPLMAGLGSHCDNLTRMQDRVVDPAPSGRRARGQGHCKRSTWDQSWGRLPHPSVLPTAGRGQSLASGSAVSRVTMPTAQQGQPANWSRGCPRPTLLSKASCQLLLKLIVTQ